MARPVTIVTGGSRGIGAATCVRLAREGHDIAFSYVRDPEAAERTAREVRSEGARCVAVRADVADEAAVDLLFDTTAAELAAPTGLVNNAGVSGPLTRLADADTDVLRRVLDVNVLGTLLTCRRAARDMTGGGAVVNVSSGAATIGGPGEYVHYAASKAAVDALTVGLSKELGPGIRVNAVAPGAVDTSIHAEMGDAGRAHRIGAATPLGRAGRPDEIASAIVWLLSPDASYTTGAVLRVAGGR